MIPKEENNNLSFSSRLDLKELLEAVTQIKTQIQKIIVGQNNFIELLIMALLADGHVLIEGVPGVAKTITAKLLSKCVNSKFSRIQFTPDLMPSDILGTSIFNVKTTEFEFKKGPIFSNLILIDEVNRSPAKTQSALFEVMEERQITLDGYQFKMPPPFMVLATQNPIEQEGTYALPEAQLDRFLFKINVGYPEKEDEIALLKAQILRKDILPETQIETVLDEAKLLQYRQLIYDIASKNEEIGTLEEAVKWGQPSFQTLNPKSGTAIRLGYIEPVEYAIYVHCQTSLIAEIKEVYPDLKFDGNRAIILNVEASIPLRKISHFIYLALTYHHRKNLGIGI